MCRVESSSKGLSRTESDWTDVATKAIIVTIALAAITAFALCFVKSPYLPKNIFNNQLVWVYGSVGFLTVALLVFMANKGGGGSNFGANGVDSDDDKTGDGIGLPFPSKRPKPDTKQPANGEKPEDPPDLFRRKSRAAADEDVYLPDDDD